MEKQNQQQEEESDKQNHVHNQHVEDDFEEEEEKQVDVEEVKHPIPNSPPLDLHHTSSPPLDLHRTSSPSSPPLDLHHTSTPSSPPLDFLHISSPSSPPLDLHHHQSQPTSPPLDLHHTPKSPPPPPPQRKPKPAADGRRFTSSILKRSRTEVLIRRVLLCSRVCGFLFCLVSFSVLASDKNRGWALDSFYHYKEFRFLLLLFLFIDVDFMSFVVKQSYLILDFVLQVLISSERDCVFVFWVSSVWFNLSNDNWKTTIGESYPVLLRFLHGSGGSNLDSCAFSYYNETLDIYT